MQAIKKTGTDWRERRMRSELSMERNLKLKLEWSWGGGRSVKNGRGVREGCFVKGSIQLVQRMPYQRKLLKRWEDFPIREALHTARYANDLVLLPTRNCTQYSPTWVFLPFVHVVFKFVSCAVLLVLRCVVCNCCW